MNRDRRPDMAVLPGLGRSSLTAPCLSRSIRSGVARAGGDFFDAVQRYPAVLLDRQGVVGWL
jgi:hypothetical protein